MPMAMVGNLQLHWSFWANDDGFSNHSEATAFQLAVEKDPIFTYGYIYSGRALKKGRVNDAITAYKKAIIIEKTSRAANEAAYQIRHLEKR